MSDPYARYTRLKFDRPHPKVLRVTMDNGRMNTADDAMHAELAEIWRDVDRDDSVNVRDLHRRRQGVLGRRRLRHDQEHHRGLQRARPPMERSARDRLQRH